MAGKPIFYDATGRRATRIRRISWIVGMAVAVMLTGFGFSLVLAPPLAVLQLPGKPVAVHPKELVRRAENPGLLDRAERLATQARHRRAARALARRHHRDLDRRALPAILAPQKGRSLAIGFYTNWGGRNDPSWPALRRSLK
jgi:hypothetical protein